ncbi:MAG: hypothetical protein WD771_07935 [Gemmatimonadaceae bacterium]
MSKYLVRLVTGLAVVAMPMVAVEAQTCSRINGVNSGSCSVDANLTVPTIVTLTVPASIVVDPIADWNAFFTAGVVDSTYNEIGLTVRSNVGDVALTVTASALSGTAAGVAGNTRTFADYGYKVLAAGTCTADGYTAFTGAAQALSSIPTGPLDAPTLTLCVAAEFDPADLTTLRAGVYTLPLAVIITGP